jgi:cobalt-zinc-cadmium resistance protein CzcA
MIARIIEWSIRWRILVISMTLGIAVVGVYAALQLPIDAVPDVTSNQVQINSVAPAFTPEEMEQYVTVGVAVRAVAGHSHLQRLARHLSRAAAGPGAIDRRAA